MALIARNQQNLSGGVFARSMEIRRKFAKRFRQGCCTKRRDESGPPEIAGAREVLHFPRKAGVAPVVYACDTSQAVNIDF